MALPALPELLETLRFLLALVTTLCFSYQILYLVLPFFSRRKESGPCAPKRYAILIAARNEEAVLPHLLDSILAQDYPGDCFTVYVVADNCTDRTAVVAEAHGARVFSRFNREQVGKGYALNYLLTQIDLETGLDAYDAFLIFDADNLLRPDYLRQMNSVCAAGYQAFCGYRNTKNFGGSWLSAGYGLWYLHDSAHLNRSRMRLGVSCAVTGTGFGFTRELLKKCGGWRFFTLTEDIEFSTWCATNGIVIGYCHDAVLYDEQPTSFRQSWRQRTRWVQGGLQVSWRYAGDYLKGMAKGGRTGWASFEAATLSLWGCAFATLSAAAIFFITWYLDGWQALLSSLLLALAGTYLSLFAAGALTLVTQWKRISAPAGQKLSSLFAFPLFMLTYIPIGLTAVFRKFQWQPIAHTVAISAGELMKK